MSNVFERGIVRKITFDIEYPNGDRLTPSIDNAGDIAKLVFDAKHLPRGASKTFNVSKTDWKENPAMLVVFRDEAHKQPIPYCTHNGCKRSG